MAGPSRFEIRDLSKGASQVLAVDGELDLATVGALSRAVDERLAERPTNLTLNLSAVTFMDSSGLRLLIELGERARREEWQLKLLPSVHEPANAVLRMTGADRALPFESPPQA